jgi:putative FmdB family regulatory protein
MPTYEYECTKCGKQWERFQSIKADPERDCPRCGRATARRKVGIGFAILTGGRRGDDGPAGGASDGAAGSGTKAAEATGAKGAGDATAGAGTAGDAKAAAGDAPAKAAKDAKAAPAAAAPKDDGTLNSTHPARDGRGAGNLRDAIARQRAAGPGKVRKAAPSAGKPPKAGNNAKRGKR